MGVVADECERFGVKRVRAVTQFTGDACVMDANLHGTVNSGRLSRRFQHVQAGLRLYSMGISLAVRSGGLNRDK